MTHTPMTYEEALTLAVLHSGGAAPKAVGYSGYTDGWDVFLGNFKIFIGREETHGEHIMKSGWLKYAYAKLVFAYCEHHHLTLEQA